MTGVDVSEKTVEQTHDGVFRRQPNYFTARFGDGPDQLPVEPDRYRLIVHPGCGWSRRQLVVRRLLGLEDAIAVGYVSHRGEDGWEFADQPGGVDAVLGVPRLNDLYRRTVPDYFDTGRRGTVPTVVDLASGLVVTNDYHTLSVDLETAWRPFHRPDAPDLYPEDLRGEIDALNVQLFDDVNNGPYKVLFATQPAAARVARGVFEARLAELDHRLASRRYLFGDRLTDSDVRLFITLLSFDSAYRPGFPPELADVVRVSELPHLWAYARDLFATPGFVDDRELEAVRLKPRADGTYGGFFGAADQPEDPLAAWREPHGRDSL